MDVGHLSERLRPDPGPGRAGRRRERRRRRLEPLPGRVAALADGDLRAPRPPPGRRARAADVAEPRSRDAASIRTTRGPSRPAGQPADLGPGLEVGRPVGARRCAEAGHTCDRVPLAISPKRCVDAKWCHTGCIFGAKNSLITNYLPSAERLRRADPSGVRGPVRAPVVGAPVPLSYGVTATGRGRAESVEIECKALVLVDGRDGQRADPHALAQRAAGAVRPGRQAPRRQRRPRRRDRVRPEEGPARCSACPGYRRLPQGQADHDDDLRLLGRPPRPPLRRHPLHAPGDLPLVADQLPLRRRPRTRRAIRRGGACRRSRRSRTGPTASSCWRWSRTPTTASSTWRRPAAAAPCGRTAGRSPSGPSRTRCPSSRCAVREAANAAMKRIAERKGLGRFMKLTETQGGVRVAPARWLPHGRIARPRRRPIDSGARVRLRGPVLRRLLDHPDLAGSQPVADDRRRVASAAPICSCAGRRTLGLPARPAGMRRGVPSEIVGERVVVPVPRPPRKRKRPAKRRPRRVAGRSDSH